MHEQYNIVQKYEKAKLQLFTVLTKDLDEKLSQRLECTGCALNCKVFKSPQENMKSDIANENPIAHTSIKMKIRKLYRYMALCFNSNNDNEFVYHIRDFLFSCDPACMFDANKKLGKIKENKSSYRALLRSSPVYKTIEDAFDVVFKVIKQKMPQEEQDCVNLSKLWSSVQTGEWIRDVHHPYKNNNDQYLYWCIRRCFVRALELYVKAPETVGFSTIGCVVGAVFDDKLIALQTCDKVQVVILSADRENNCPNCRM